MAKNEVKYIYCVECGKKNEATTKRCVECKKKIDPKDHSLKDYFWGQIKGNVQDSTLELIEKFIRRYMYGILMSCSIVFTGTAILMNTVFKDQIKEVDQRPTYKYLGEGLDPMELLEKYTIAAQEGDFGTIYGLQLAKTMPDIYSEVMSKQDESMPMFAIKHPIKTHTLVNFADIYFKDGREPNYLSYEEATGEGKYGDYEYYRYKVYTIFCENNNCEAREPGNFLSTYRITDLVELVLVDGNYYVTGEMHHYEQMNESDIIARGAIYNSGGDMTKVDFAEAYSDTCSGEECLEKFGGMETKDYQW